VKSERERVLEEAIAEGYKAISDTSPVEGLNHTLLTFVQRIRALCVRFMSATVKRPVLYGFGVVSHISTR
jgi:hypothetical protein